MWELNCTMASTTTTIRKCSDDFEMILSSNSTLSLGKKQMSWYKCEPNRILLAPLTGDAPICCMPLSIKTKIQIENYWTHDENNCVALCLHFTRRFVTFGYLNTYNWMRLLQCRETIANRNKRTSSEATAKARVRDASQNVLCTQVHIWNGHKATTHVCF